MSFYIYLVALPTPNCDSLKEVWNLYQEKELEKFYPPAPNGKKWGNTDESFFSETELKIQNGKATVDCDKYNGRDGAENTPFFWFPKDIPSYHKWGCPATIDSQSVNLSSGWPLSNDEQPDELGEFQQRSATIGKDKNLSPPDPGEYQLWSDPIVLQVDLHEQGIPEQLLELVKYLLDSRNFTTQIVPAVNKYDYLRYLCRRRLAAQVREQSNCPNSIMRKIVFPKDEANQGPDMFDILDRLGGFFYVSDFGSSKQPAISFCVNHLTDLQKCIVQFVTDKLRFELKLPIENDNANTPQILTPLPSASEWREAPLKVAGKYPFEWKNVAETIQARYRNCDIWKKELNFMDDIINEYQVAVKDFQLPDLLQWFLPGTDGKIDIIRLIKSFAEEFVVPRSKIIFDFPQGDFWIAENENDYNIFRDLWSFDLIRSQLGGASTFLRRFLSFPDENARLPENHYQFGWWNDWHDALWYNDADKPYKVSDKGLSSVLGKFHLDYSRLDEPELRGYWQPSRIWFAPATEYFLETE